MAERAAADSTELDEQSSGDSGVTVGDQVTFDIPADGSGTGSSGSSDAGTPTRRKRRTRAQIDAEEGISPDGGSAPSRITFNIRKGVIDFSNMLQKRFGGAVIQLDKNGNPRQEPLWTLDRDEADMIVGAIDGVRSKLPMMPEKWALPVAAAWLGGVVLFTFSQRISIHKQLKAQAIAQRQQATQQAMATAGMAEHRNGATPAGVGAVVDVPGGLPPITEDGEPPADWDSAFRNAN